MKAIVDGLRALGPARLAAMGAVALGMLGMLALMMLRGGTEPMALLYGDLDLRDSAQVVDQLARRHIPYRIAGSGSQILVAADQIPEARLALAKDGLPAGGSIGTRSSTAATASARPNSSRRSMRPARWKASLYAPSASSMACVAHACTLCCRDANLSRVSVRRPRPV